MKGVFKLSLMQIWQFLYLRKPDGESRECLHKPQV